MGYTAYETDIQMAGATSYYMPLKKENDFLPDLEVIPEEIAASSEDDDFKLPRESCSSNGS